MSEIPVENIIPPHQPSDGQGAVGRSTEPLGLTSEGYQYADELLKRARSDKEAGFPDTRGGRTGFDEILEWHQRGISLVEMAMRLRDEYGHSVWDTLTFDEQLVLVRASHDPKQADAVRAATLATLGQIAAGTPVTLTNAAPSSDFAPDPRFLIPVECHVGTPDRDTYTTVASFVDDKTEKIRLDPLG